MYQMGAAAVLAVFLFFFVLVVVVNELAMRARSRLDPGFVCRGNSWSEAIC